MVIGNLGADPVVHTTKKDTLVTTFSVATTDYWKNSGGESQEKTEWHRIVAYNKLANICGEHLKKGSKVYIEGKMQTRKWEDESTGSDRYTTEIIASSLEMLGGGSSSTSSHDQEQ